MGKLQEKLKSIRKVKKKLTLDVTALRRVYTKSHDATDVICVYERRCRNISKKCEICLRVLGSQFRKLF